MPTKRSRCSCATPWQSAWTSLSTCAAARPRACDPGLPSAVRATWPRESRPSRFTAWLLAGRRWSSPRTSFPPASRTAGEARHCGRTAERSLRRPPCCRVRAGSCPGRSGGLRSDSRASPSAGRRGRRQCTRFPVSRLLFRPQGRMDLLAGARAVQAEVCGTQSVAEVETVYQERGSVHRFERRGRGKEETRGS